MSTRASIYYGNSGDTEYHAYRELAEGGTVHLTVRDMNTTVTIRLPDEIWNAIVSKAARLIEVEG